VPGGHALASDAEAGAYTRHVKVVGLYLVRNEVDVIETNLRHHLSTLLDEAIVVDNGSTDGTFELVADLADELPVQLASEVGLPYQSDRLTRMARFAARQGADWILPIDADEFWVAGERPFRSVLQDAPADARALFVNVVNFVQQRDVLVARPGVLATMTMRPQRPVGTPEEASRLMQTGEVAWLELPYTPKCVHRASSDVFIPAGNHLNGTDNGVPTDALTCLHAPMRARSVLAYKIDQGRRLVEEQSSPEAGWHVKRLWQMARAGTGAASEWEASSYQDGALTVNGTDHELVRDERLKDAVAAVAPLVRTVGLDATDPLGDMEPPVAAYVLALTTVPGWCSALDARMLAGLDRMQRAHAIEGDLFEIGAAYGKSAILLGYLARQPHERLTVCDVFEHKETIDPESMPIVNHLYADVTETRFRHEYGRFHQRPPGVIVGPSGNIDAAERAGTCRIVHVDGGHAYDVVRKDIETARRLLGSGGLVAFGGMTAPHTPGSALAVWELVLRGGFVPLCLTESKLYGTWDGDAFDWMAGIDEWVNGRPDIGVGIHTLSGWPVRRVFAFERPPVGAERLVRIPDLEVMAEA
jgi:hypothetical protein